MHNLGVPADKTRTLPADRGSNRRSRALARGAPHRVAAGRTRFQSHRLRSRHRLRQERTAIACDSCATSSAFSAYGLRCSSGIRANRSCITLRPRAASSAISLPIGTSLRLCRPRRRHPARARRCDARRGLSRLGARELTSCARARAWRRRRAALYHDRCANRDMLAVPRGRRQQRATRPLHRGGHRLQSRTETHNASCRQELVRRPSGRRRAGCEPPGSICPRRFRDRRRRGTDHRNRQPDGQVLEHPARQLVVGERWTTATIRAVSTGRRRSSTATASSAPCFRGATQGLPTGSTRSCGIPD